MSELPQILACEDADDIYHVYSLCFARLDRTAHQNFMVPDLHDGPMPLDYNMWILHNSARTVLVDTGFGPRAAKERGRILDVDPIEALGRLGIDPDTISDVLITHLHYDHAGNMDRLTRARFHVQESEVVYATGPCMCEKFMRFPYDVEDVVTFIRHTFAERVVHHCGDAAPLPGISLHHLPGHTAGIQAVKVNTPRGPVLLASDVSHYYANFLRKSPFSLIINVPETLESYDAMLRLVPGTDNIIPGHDPRVREIYPMIEVEGIKLAELHKAPLPHDLASLSLEA
jgi:glyoxylase-like metal-dependent hydrolase (beta-lactamase superfamily II)